MQLVQPSLGDGAPWSFGGIKAASIVAQAKQRLQAEWLNEEEVSKSAVIPAQRPQLQVCTCKTLAGRPCKHIGVVHPWILH